MEEILDFEPYSAEIFLRLKKAKTAKERNFVFESVFNHPRMIIIDGTFDLVRIISGHKTNGNWHQTLEMAKSLAMKGIPTAFLPEKNADISADAISKINKHWRIVDFKYCVTTKWNTIQTTLKKAFEQGDGAIIQLVNANSGQLKDAIEYLQRKDIAIKDTIILNKYGKFLELKKKDFDTGKYLKKIKGLL